MNQQYKYLKKKYFPIDSKRNDLIFYRAYLAMLRYKKPISRSLQSRAFYDDEFMITNTLDPRPETEQLVELILSHVQHANNILDICTGSGCILLSLLKKYKRARGIGTDISIKALETANTNAKNLYIGRRAKFVLSDYAEAVHDTFDLIVTNPPYVEEIMNPELQYDPVVALLGNIDVYKHIIIDLHRLIHNHTIIAFEINELYGDRIISMLNEYGFNGTIYQDLCSRDRFILATKILF